MQADFNTVIQWIFAQLNAVLDFISRYYILRVALFLPIAGALILAVYYMLQVFDIGKYSILKFGNNKPFTVSSMSFGSVHSRLNGSSFGHSLVSNYRKKQVLKKKEEERKYNLFVKEQERKEREALKQWEKQQFKKHETIFYVPDGKGGYIKTLGTSWSRNTIDPYMTEEGSVSKNQAERIRAAMETYYSDNS